MQTFLQFPWLNLIVLLCASCPRPDQFFSPPRSLVTVSLKNIYVYFSAWEMTEMGQKLCDFVWKLIPLDCAFRRKSSVARVCFMPQKVVSTTCCHSDPNRQEVIFQIYILSHDLWPVCEWGFYEWSLPILTEFTRRCIIFFPMNIAILLNWFRFFLSILFSFTLPYVFASFQFQETAFRYYAVLQSLFSCVFSLASCQFSAIFHAQFYLFLCLMTAVSWNKKYSYFLELQEVHQFSRISCR